MLTRVDLTRRRRSFLPLAAAGAICLSGAAGAATNVFRGPPAALIIPYRPPASQQAPLKERGPVALIELLGVPVAYVTSLDAARQPGRIARRHQHRRRREPQAVLR
jgi:hypothetical protein